MLCRRLELFSEASAYSVDGSKFKVNTRTGTARGQDGERRLVDRREQDSLLPRAA